MENLGPQIRNNVLGDPLFVDGNNSYVQTPWMYDFNLTENSPAIDFGLAQFALPADLRGVNRLPNPDAGALEFLANSSLRLNGLNPPSVQNGIEHIVRLWGENFSSQAEVMIASPEIGKITAPADWVTLLNESEIELEIPAEAPAGSYTITVFNPLSGNNPGEESNSQQLTIIQDVHLLPVARVFPKSYTLGEEKNLVVFGENLPSAGSYYKVEVSYNGGRWYVLPPEYVTLDSTRLMRLLMMPGIPIGRYDVKITTVYGAAGDYFMITAPAGSNTSTSVEVSPGTSVDPDEESITSSGGSGSSVGSVSSSQETLSVTSNESTMTDSAETSTSAPTTNVSTSSDTKTPTASLEMEHPHRD
jgi:hypothetical protein